MGTEIIAITIFQLLIMAYAVLVRLIRAVMIKAGVIEASISSIYTFHAALMFIIASLPSIAFLLSISDNYSFAIGYILIIQTPIIIITLWSVMAVHEWQNLTNKLWLGRKKAAPHI